MAGVLYLLLGYLALKTVTGLAITSTVPICDGQPVTLRCQPTGTLDERQNITKIVFSRLNGGTKIASLNIKTGRVTVDPAFSARWNPSRVFRYVLQLIVTPKVTDIGNYSCETKVDSIVKSETWITLTWDENCPKNLKEDIEALTAKDNSLQKNITALGTKNEDLQNKLFGTDNKTTIGLVFSSISFFGVLGLIVVISICLWKKKTQKLNVKVDDLQKKITALEKENENFRNRPTVVTEEETQDPPEGASGGTEETEGLLPKGQNGNENLEDQGSNKVALDLKEEKGKMVLPQTAKEKKDPGGPK